MEFNLFTVSLIAILFFATIEITSSLDIRKLTEFSSVRMEQRRPSYNQYLQLVEDMVGRQSDMAFAADVKLNSDEQKVNEILMKYKHLELDAGFETPLLFSPSRHLFNVLQNITNSDLFKLIRNIPKGGILHAHDTALCSTDFVVSLTKREYLWQFNDPEGSPKAFRFSMIEPARLDNPGEWVLVANERTRLGDGEYDRQIRPYFTLYRSNPSEVYTDINAVWAAFMNIFILFDGIVTYAPVWRDYYYQALKECQEDGVDYLEIRGVLPTVCIHKLFIEDFKICFR